MSKISLREEELEDSELLLPVCTVFHLRMPRDFFVEELISPFKQKNARQAGNH